MTNIYGGAGSTELSAGADSRAVTVTGLDNRSRYQIRVTARNDLDWGPPSAPVVGQPVGYPYPVTGIAVTPTTPTPQDDSGIVRVSWPATDANGPEPVSYQFYRSVSGGPWEAGPTPSGQLWTNDTVAYHGQVIGLSLIHI